MALLTSEQGVVLSALRSAPPGPIGTATRAIRPSSEHHTMVWVDGGSARISCNEQVIVVRGGQAVWVPAATEFFAVSSGTLWSARFLARSCPSGWHELLSLSLGAIVIPNLMHLARRPRPRWARALLSAVVDQISEALVEGRNPLRVPLPTDPAARQAATALIADPLRRDTIADLARSVGTSERSLQRHFTEQTGLPISEWRRLLRLRMAIGLLVAGGSVESTARSCGFTSPDVMNRTFRTYLGLSPSSVRRLAGPVSDEAGLWRKTSESWRRAPGAADLASVGSDYRLMEGQQNMRTPTRPLALAVAAALLAAACGSDSEADDDESAVATSTVTVDDDAGASGEQTDGPTNEDDMGANTRTVTDAVGNEVVVPAEPTRIASMDLYTTTRLLDLGLHPVISGVPDPEWELGPEHIDAWVALGFDAELLDHETLPYGGEFNIEAIAEADPDLIVGQPAYIDSVVDQLAGIAPVVQWDSGILSITEQIETVGSLVGAEDRATELTGAFTERTTDLASGIEIGSIALMDNNVYDGVFYVYGEGGGITNDWSSRFGVDVVAPADVELDTTGGAYVSTENIPSLDDADVVVVFGEPLIGEPLRDNSLFRRLAAVETERVCDAGNFNFAVGLHGLDDYAAQLEGVAACLRGLTAN